jgi:predicted AlkP superfamily phosphohydrolase/phosphomutase
MALAPGKVLVIGLDLGDGRLLYEWANEGHLPTVAALIDAGAWGALETTAGQLHVSAWPSIYTGVGPGEHGVYYTFQPAPGVQGYQRFHEGLYGRPTFWRLLDAADRRCTVFDAPYAHPEPGFAGTQVFEWGTWAHYLTPRSTPANVLRELEIACGKYPLGLEAHDLGFKPLDPADMQQRLIGAVRRKAEAALWLMRRGDLDLFMTVFGETHAGAHYCWDPNGNQDLMRPLYQELDRAIASLVEAAGPDVAVFVASGDAVGPNRAGWHLLPEVLARLGYFASAETSQADESGAQVKTRFDPVRAARDLLPKDVRKDLARMLPTRVRDKLARRVDTATIDWTHTRAYCLPTDLEGCIRINLKGREPEGQVAAGAEYEEACRDLRSALEGLIEPRTGTRAVREVLQVDKAFPGPRREHLPDLIVLWHAATPITALASNRIGEVRGESPDPRPGTHTEPGFVLVRGNGVPPGRTIENAHIFDLAPTIMEPLGVEAPAHMTGRRLLLGTTIA